MIQISRVLGNLIPGRHAENAGLIALEMILEHEPTPSGTEKHFVLNRLYKDREAYVELLKKYGYELGEAVTELPFDVDEYKRAKDPVHYLTNVNAARNHCLSRARYFQASACLPLDSRCIFTLGDWQHIEGCLEEATAAGKGYVIIPQARLQLGEEWDVQLAPSHFRSKHPVTGAYEENEYAVAFTRHAPHDFDESRVFGDVDKAELLVYLGVPGPWCVWLRNSKRPVRECAQDVYESGYRKATRALRVLPSGHAEADRNPVVRGQVRAEGLRKLAEDANLCVFT